MKAILWKKFGGAEALAFGELEKPEPRADELLVRIKAFTVNRTDCAMLKSSLWIMRLQTGLFSPRLPVIGTDFAGDVVAAGAKVDRFSVGDRIFGFDDAGLMSHSEYMVIKQSRPLGKIPDTADYITAAASIEGPHYAENFLNKVNFRKDQRVFVHGGTGGIGSALIQLIKLRGGYVMASGRSQHLNLLRENGADETIDYTSANFWDHDGKYDYVFDAVGKGTFGKFKGMLNEKGVYISSELGPRGQNPLLAMLTAFSGGRKVKFPVPFNKQRSVDMMAELLRQENYTPLIDRTYALEETPEAFAYVMQGQKVGNVVIRVD